MLRVSLRKTALGIEKCFFMRTWSYCNYKSFVFLLIPQNCGAICRFEFFTSSYTYHYSSFPSLVFSTFFSLVAFGFFFSLFLFRFCFFWFWFLLLASSSFISGFFYRSFFWFEVGFLPSSLDILHLSSEFKTCNNYI